MKSRRELRNIAAMIDDNVVSVRCKFTLSGTNYVFLCTTDLASSLKEGDFVIVTCSPKAKPNLGYAVCTVNSVDATCDIEPDAEYEYQWILSKIDTERGKKLGEWQDSVADTLMARQRDSARRAVLTEIGLNRVDVLTLPKLEKSE